MVARLGGTDSVEGQETLLAALTRNRDTLAVTDLRPTQDAMRRLARWTARLVRAGAARLDALS